MKVHIMQLKEGPNELSWSSEKDAEARSFLLFAKQQGVALVAPFTAALSVTKLEPNYYFRIKLAFAVELSCLRCADSVVVPLASNWDFGAVHLLASRSNRRKTQVSSDTDSVDLLHFSGNELEMEALFLEQMLLDVPYRVTCTKAQCQDPAEPLDPPLKTNPFSVLQKHED